MFSEGTHKVHVTGSAMGTTGTGKEQIAISLTNDAGESGAWYGFFTAKAIGITERALQALGWDMEEHQYNFALLNGTPALIGAECLAVCETEPDQNGNPRTKVSWLNPLDGGAALKEKMSDEQAAIFSSTLRKRFIAERGAPKPKVADDLPI